MELLAPDAARPGVRGLHGERDTRGGLVADRESGEELLAREHAPLAQGERRRHCGEAGVGDCEEHVLVVEGEGEVAVCVHGEGKRDTCAVAEHRCLLAGAELARQLDVKAPDTRLAAAEAAGDDVQRRELECLDELVGEVVECRLCGKGRRAPG